MLNKLLAFIRRYSLVQPGDTVICAVSGGADSMALLWAMYLLREKLEIRLEAAHFNHRLRGEESMADEGFVKNFCAGYKIPLHLGEGSVTPGKKGLEAAAREARYAFLQQLPGKIATAHTADDNAETVLMHMVRGTGLKGLGGITPVRNNLIRPMLSVTREEVLAFLEEYHVSYVTDSSNETDQFLRNRLRHRVLPLLTEENPRIAENLSAMALRLRDDAEDLERQASHMETLDVMKLRQMTPAIRARVLSRALKKFGVCEPDAEHIARLEDLVYSDRPSATADFPGNVRIGRNYDRLEKLTESTPLYRELSCNGTLELPELGLRVICEEVDAGDLLFKTKGKLVLRSRISGDRMRLPGGTKSLKKLYIDKKIPASHRERIPVIADDVGVLCVYGLGANLDRITQGSGVRILFEPFDDVKKL